LAPIGYRNCKPVTGSGPALGSTKTQTCCGAVEWRSQSSDVRSFSREARRLALSNAGAQKSRRLRGSYASGARDPRLTFALHAQAEGASWRQILQLARHEVRRALPAPCAWLPTSVLGQLARFFKFFHQALCRGRSSYRSNRPRPLWLRHTVSRAPQPKLPTCVHDIMRNSKAD